MDFLFLIFLALLIVAPFLQVKAWRLLRRHNGEKAPVSSERQVGLVGLGCAVLGYLLPWAVFAYHFILLHSGRPVRGEELVDGRAVVTISMALAALSLVLGAFGPKGSRGSIMVSALSIGFWLFIPSGV